MKISNHSLAHLKEQLPRGSVPKIRDRLKKKSFTYSEQYIYRCLDPAKKAYSSVIVDEAILLCEELRKIREEREKRVSHIKLAVK
jgi:hypothetical protein